MLRFFVTISFLILADSSLASASAWQKCTAWLTGRQSNVALALPSNLDVYNQAFLVASPLTVSAHEIETFRSNLKSKRSDEIQESLSSDWFLNEFLAEVARRVLSQSKSDAKKLLELKMALSLSGDSSARAKADSRAYRELKNRLSERIFSSLNISEKSDDSSLGDDRFRNPHQIAIEVNLENFKTKQYSINLSHLDSADLEKMSAFLHYLFYRRKFVAVASPYLREKNREVDNRYNDPSYSYFDHVPFEDYRIAYDQFTDANAEDNERRRLYRSDAESIFEYAILEPLLVMVIEGKYNRRRFDIEKFRRNVRRNFSTLKLNVASPVILLADATIESLESRADSLADQMNELGKLSSAIPVEKTMNLLNAKPKDEELTTVKSKVNAWIRTLTEAEEKFRLLFSEYKGLAIETKKASEEPSSLQSEYLDLSEFLLGQIPLHEFKKLSIDQTLEKLKDLRSSLRLAKSANFLPRASED